MNGVSLVGFFLAFVAVSGQDSPAPVSPSPTPVPTQATTAIAPTPAPTLAPTLSPTPAPALTAPTGQYTPDWASLDARPLPKWYDEAKFGIFIHWGVYSVPSYSNEWYWHDMYKGNNHKRVADFHKKVYGDDFKYQDFAPMFKAQLFDPARWAQIFKRAGAKYVVLTSKHHEGFANWPSEVSWNWNSMDIGPHRDLVGELADAVREEGLTYGLYYSLLEFFHPAYVEDQKNGFKNRTFPLRKTLPELKELVNKYKPDVIWSDGDWDASSDYWGSTDFLAWLYNDSPVKQTVVTNDRWGAGTQRTHGGYYSGNDRQQPGPSLLGHKWENCMTVDAGSWGYNRGTPLSSYLSAFDILRELISTVAFGGNLLLNVGPTSDGLILPIFEERLSQVGDYLAINGEAIYGTAPHPVVQNATLPGGVEAYLTTKPDTKEVYFLTVGWPDFTTAGPASKDVAIPLPSITSALLLGRAGRHERVFCTPSVNSSSSICTLPLTVALSKDHDPNGLVLMLSPEPYI